jgi:3-oxoadipate enol-lactonase
MREFTFEADGVRLFAVEDGAGAPVVMLHGGMADHHAAWPLVAPLAGSYRVVAPDLRSCGKSHCGEPLTWDRLADDLALLLDHIGAPRAVVGGISGGSGVAVRFALSHPDRLAGLALILPVFAGADRGLTPFQAGSFQGLNALASRAPAEGVQVLRPLYQALPEAIRERAIAMLEAQDPASIAATAAFLASGAQPFATAADLAAITASTLLIPGNDPTHPSEVADLYAAHLTNGAVARFDNPDPMTQGPAFAAALGEFCGRIGW